MALKTYFITGTDTNIGKTQVVLCLLHKLKSKGFSPIAIKPLAAGIDTSKAKFFNEDAIQIQKHNAKFLPYEVINPILFHPPVAPHISAHEQGVTLTKTSVVRACDAGFEAAEDCLLIEGAGGWHVPLNEMETMGDVVLHLQVPVILVSGIRLGCLNHTLLTADKILSSGLKMGGWIANCLDPNMMCIQENIDTLKQKLAAPLLGVIPYSSQLNLENMSKYLDVGGL